MNRFKDDERSRRQLTAPPVINRLISTIGANDLNYRLICKTDYLGLGATLP